MKKPDESNLIEPDDWTCGKGIAANAPLPAALGKLASAQAAVLQAHMRALDPSDPAAKLEYDTYDVLVQEFQQIGALLMKLAQKMTDSRNLPVAPHDEQAMMDRAVLTSFETYVQAKQELLILLQTTVGEDQAMLDEMKRVM